LFVSTRTTKRLISSRVMQDGQVPDSKWSTKAAFETEGFVAAAAGANGHVGRLMHPRVEVVTEVGLAPKGALAVGAVGLHIANGYLGLFLAAE